MCEKWRNQERKFDKCRKKVYKILINILIFTFPMEN